MTRSEMEVRRLSAIPQLASYQSLGELAKTYNVSRETISRWRKALKNGDSLEAHKTPGRPPRIDAEAERKIRQFFAVGPRIVLQIDQDRWTQARFAEAIEKHLKIKISGDHMGRIMHRLGLTPKRTRRSHITYEIF